MGKVLRAFFQGGRPVQIPAQRRKRDIILEELSRLFEPGREVNERLGALHPDCFTLRRELVGAGLLVRSSGYTPARTGTRRPERAECVHCRSRSCKDNSAAHRLRSAMSTLSTIADYLRQQDMTVSLEDNLIALALGEEGMGPMLILQTDEMNEGTLYVDLSITLEMGVDDDETFEALLLAANAINGQSRLCRVALDPVEDDESEHDPESPAPDLLLRTASGLVLGGTGEHDLATLRRHISLFLAEANAALQMLSGDLEDLEELLDEDAERGRQV
nr:DUF2087 domain-containing protein [Deinobacterium chartae]